MKDLSTKTLFVTFFLPMAVSFVTQIVSQDIAKIEQNEKDLLCQRTLVEAASGYKENLEEVRLFLENGIDVDMVDSLGETALMQASRWGRLETAKVLMANNANVNIVSSFGETALMQASRWGRLEIAKVLITNNADVNIVSSFGETALMQASRGGYLELVKLLLKNNANVYKKSNLNLTALMQASIALSEASALKDRLSEIVRLLESAKKEKSTLT